MRRPLSVLLFLFSPLAADAACSRPIVVPSSSLGKMIVVDAASDEVSGIYPDALRDYGKRAGCEFVFPAMPRIRAEMMMQAGQGDLMVGLVKVPERESWGSFFPMLGSEWKLITDRDGAPASVQELLDMPQIRFNAVRGFNFGPDYQAMLAALEKQGKLEYVNDAQTVVRKMRAGRADYTFMPSNTFAGALEELGLRDTYGKQIRYLRLNGIMPSVIGAYLSKRLTADDARQVEGVLAAMRRDGVILTGLRRQFSPAEMSSSYALPGMSNGK